MSVRVLVADDQALVRAGFRGIIEMAPGLTVVAEAGTGTAAVELARRERPDVVLMDIRMPGMDGLEATRLITGAGGPAGVPGVRVLILTMFDLDEHIYEALRGGASGFLLKDTAPEDLLAAIRVIAAGDALLAPSVTRRLIAEFADRPAPSGGVEPAAPPVTLPGITAREHEVLALIAEGHTNPEIARRLHITEGTTKTHVGHLLAKLGARDRVQLVITAFRAGLRPH
ncbi:response regulator [Embleya hyalina]|uniref:DNA-binding response regulator n=1 Tax=Embleya hyalina TaxID=516124 RepID=A0A401YJN8_9ACTN|nr:response regulator transcription factor [Embleya hyalina]GCD94788.1 DNA-binding response regulator [Embleya hyalina]